MIDECFKNCKLDDNELINVGFVKNKNNYKLENSIINNRFLLIIEIDKNNIIKSDVIEKENNEKFIPYYIKNMNGEFVSNIRNEYDSIISKIKNNFDNNILSDIVKYIKDKYNDDLEYLWPKFPMDAIIRNKKNKKWYFLVMKINKTKLNINEDKEVFVIDLLTDNINIIDNKKIFPGFHMNKKSWITIILDNSIDKKEIYKLIDNSYNIAITKK